MEFYVAEVQESCLLSSGLARGYLPVEPIHKVVSYFFAPYYYIALPEIEANLVKATVKEDLKFFIVRGGVDTRLFIPRRRDNGNVKVMVTLRPEPNEGVEVGNRTPNLLPKYPGLQ